MKQLSTLFLALVAWIAASGQAQSFGYKDYSFANQVNIGKGNGQTTNPGAWLEIGPASGTKGIIFPRGDHSLITSPVVGLMIYDTNDHKLYAYNGSSWVAVGTDPTGFIQNQFTGQQPADFWIRNAKINGTLTLFSALQHAVLGADPTGSNGLVYYDSALNNFRAYRNGTWLNVLLQGDAQTYSGADFIKNGTTLQTGASFNIDGTAQAAKMLVGTSSFVGTELLHVGSGVQFDGRATSNTIMTTAGGSFTPPTFGTTQGEAHLRVLSSTGSSNWPAITVGANDISGAQGGIYFNINSAFGTRLHFATTNNTTTGAQSRMFINETGQVAIAATSLIGTEKFRVNGDTYLDGSLRVGNLAADPSGSNGWVYYNNTTNQFKGYRNGVFKNFLMTGDADSSNMSNYWIKNGVSSQPGSFSITGTATISGGATIGGAGAGNTSINVGGSGVFSIQESTTATVNTGASSTSGGIMTFERGANAQGRYSLSFLNGNTSYTSQLGTVTGYAAGTLLFNSTGTQALFTGQSFGASFVFDNQTLANNPNAISLVYSASGSTISVPVIFKKDGSTVVQKLTQTQPAAITAAATTTIDLSTGNIFQVNLSASITTLTLNNASLGKYYFQFTQDATGSRTISWPASFKWPGGTAPTLTTTPNKTDYIECLYNGTSFLASAYTNY